MNDPSYADLTLTQYELGFDWLESLGIVAETPAGQHLTKVLNGASSRELDLALLAAELEHEPPIWLENADELVTATDELPADVAGLASKLRCTEEETLRTVRQVSGKIDLEKRAAIGSLGEHALISVLEAVEPGSTMHVAAHHDGYGYDVIFRQDAVAWHLEVKTTTKQADLRIYLSRHERDVATLDERWRLVAVGLGDSGQIEAIATVDHKLLLASAPQDQDELGRWEAARFLVPTSACEPGLSFVRRDPGARGSERLLLEHGTRTIPAAFRWASGPSGFQG